ncbi:MAG TPA: hypothetical protein VFB80_06475 [Pirellulaceae bacterium]|nr:hypothetical protein [Pirellulaceae bacterium]
MKLIRTILTLAAVAAVATPLAAADARIAIIDVGGGQTMAARCDAAGTIHVVTQTPGGPQYARSTDGGESFSQPLPVVSAKARQPGLEYTVWDVAVTKEGGVHVALGTNAWKLKLPKEEWAFFYARLEPGAQAFAPVVNINRKPSEGFSLAADDSGNVTACWMSGKLYANVSHDGGRTFGPTVEIDPSFDPCDCCTTSATYAADGRLALLYREETNNERNMFLVQWDQKQNVATRTRVSTTPWNIDACPMTYYSIVPQGDGFVAAWPTKGEVYWARLDGQGTLQSPGEIKTPGQSGMRSGVLTLTDTSGNTLVAWKKAEQLGWQLYDAQGRASGKTASAKSRGSGAAGVVSKDGRFLLFP